MLNKTLLRIREISKESEDSIISLHEVKDFIFNEINKTDDKVKLKYLVEFLEEVEYAMQEGWKFPLNANFHTHWRVPSKCTCPYFDNLDYYGFGKVINAGCVLHGI